MTPPHEAWVLFKLLESSLKSRQRGRPALRTREAARVETRFPRPPENKDSLASPYEWLLYPIWKQAFSSSDWHMAQAFASDLPAPAPTSTRSRTGISVRHALRSSLKPVKLPTFPIASNCPLPIPPDFAHLHNLGHQTDSVIFVTALSIVLIQVHVATPSPNPTPSHPYGFVSKL